MNATRREVYEAIEAAERAFRAKEEHRLLNGLSLNDPGGYIGATFDASAKALIAFRSYLDRDVELEAQVRRLIVEKAQVEVEAERNIYRAQANAAGPSESCRLKCRAEQLQADNQILRDERLRRGGSFRSTISLPGWSSRPKSVNDARACIDKLMAEQKGQVESLWETIRALEAANQVLRNRVSDKKTGDAMQLSFLYQEAVEKHHQVTKDRDYLLAQQGAKDMRIAELEKQVESLQCNLHPPIIIPRDCIQPGSFVTIQIGPHLASFSIR